MAKVDVSLVLDFPGHDDIAAEVALEFVTETVKFLHDQYRGENFNVTGLSVKQEEEPDWPSLQYIFDELADEDDEDEDVDVPW